MLVDRKLILLNSVHVQCRDTGDSEPTTDVGGTSTTQQQGVWVCEALADCLLTLGDWELSVDEQGRGL